MSLSLTVVLVGVGLLLGEAAAVGLGADVRVGVGGVLLLASGVVAVLLLVVAGVVVPVGLVGALGGRRVLVLGLPRVRIGRVGGGVRGVAVYAVGAGVVGQGLRLVDRGG